MKSTTRPTAGLALATALLASSALAWGWHGAADAQQSPGLNKAQVEKIAKKQAKKAIKKAAPKLTVRRARNADRVDNESIASLGVTVLANGAAVRWGTIGGLSLVASCPSGDSTITATAPGGTLVWDIGGVYTTDTNATNEVVTNSSGHATGMLHYKRPSGSATVTALYGWSGDGTECSFFGQMMGG